MRTNNALSLIQKIMYLEEAVMKTGALQNFEKSWKCVRYTELLLRQNLFLVKVQVTVNFLVFLRTTSLEKDYSAASLFRETPICSKNYMFSKTLKKIIWEI